MKPYTAVADTGRKTPSGVPILKILYEDGTAVLTTEKLFKLVRSEVPLDSNQWRDLIYPSIMPAMFGILSDYNIAYDDVEIFLNKFAQTVKNTADSAINRSLGIKGSYDFDMIKINEINDQAESEKTAAAPATPAASTDSGTDTGPAGGVPATA